MLDLILDLQREGTDVARYFAYAQAILGRPYKVEYVRLTDDAVGMGSEGADGVVTPIRPLRPWRDFLVEYPPGMLAPVLVPALFTTDFDAYFLLFGLEMQAVLTMAAILAVKTADAITPGSGGRALALSILLTAALGAIAVRRYDACVALAIAATIYGLATRRPMLTGAALALGVVLKGVPILLAPILIIWYATRRDGSGLKRCGGSAAVCIGATGLLYAMTAGRHMFDVFVYHADRPLEVETSFGGVLWLLKPLFPDILSVIFSYGSFNVVSVVEPALRRLAGILEAVAVLAAYTAAYVRIRRAADDRQKLMVVISATGVCLVAFMTLGKVFSAQYLTWLVPLGAVAGGACSRGVPWRLVIANVFTQAEYPYLFVAAIGFQKDTFILGLLIVGRTFTLWRWGHELLTAPAASLPSPRRRG